MPLPLVINPGDAGHIGDHESIDALLAGIASPFVVAGFAQGTHAARPAAAVLGRYYYETDTGLLFFDTGAAWLGLNSDSTQTVQLDVLGSGSTVLLGVVANEVVYGGLGAALPSGWAKMDVWVVGYLTDEYVSGAGFRRALGQVTIDGAGASKISKVSWEDIGSSAVNRPGQMMLMNRALGKTASVTLEVQNWLDEGSANVSADDVTLYVTKYRRT